MRKLGEWARPITKLLGVVHKSTLYTQTGPVEIEWERARERLGRGNLGGGDRREKMKLGGTGMRQNAANANGNESSIGHDTVPEQKG